MGNGTTPRTAATTTAATPATTTPATTTPAHTARIHLPLALRDEAGGARTLEVTCAGVDDAIAQLCAAYPTLRRHLFDESGALRPHVNVFVNERDVRTLGRDGARLRPGDEIHIVPSIAGG